MRHKIASPATASALAAAMLALEAAAIPLAVLTHQLTFGSVIGPALLMLPFASVGFVVARRQPSNPIGWILLVLAVCFMLSVVAGMYAVLAFRFGHPGLLLARLAVALTQAWAALVILLPLPIVLFPDGRLPSPRWRWTAWAYGVLFATFIAGLAIQDAAAFTEHPVRVDSSGQLANISSSGIAELVQFVMYVGIVLSWVAAKVLDYRRSSGERRQQLKWLMAGGAVSVVSLAISLQANVGPLFLGIAALPLSIGVGILKYRLYDIDRLISRTISYALVTALLVGMFVGLVALTTDVLPFSSPVGVAASTLAAAALFNPLRLRVQRLVDRRFNRARYDADALVASFMLRLRDAVELDAVQSGLLDAVGRAVEPAHLSIWIREGSPG